MRSVYCADALAWLPEHPHDGAVVTSLPDAAETGQPLEEWARWFIEAAAMCMVFAADAASSIFYQTDRKADGHLVSKAALLFEAQHTTGVNLLWHKIVLRREVGGTDLHRPGFTHLMAFSRTGKPGTATPDVMERGPVAYPNGMGLRAAGFAVRFASKTATTICDPFCGRGTVLAVAEAFGLNAIGVDIASTQVDAARSLVLRHTAGTSLAPTAAVL